MSVITSLDQYLRGLAGHQPARPCIAFFDLDRTLVAGYTMTAFVFEQMRRGLLGPRQVARQSVNYLQYGRARIAFSELLEDAAADFAGVSVERAEAFAREVFRQHIEPHIFREARRLIAAHRLLGHEVVMVTSSTQFQANPAARALGIGKVHCTQLEARDGMLTGRIAGKACHGRGKANAGRRAARAHGADPRDCWFYTDSLDDLPLLEIVGHPVAVNAHPELTRLATREGWPQLAFNSRAEPSVEGAMRTGLVCNALLAAAAAGGAAWLGSRSPREARNAMARVLGELGGAMAGLDLEVAGQGHLETRRPAVFVFNHQSYIDALVLLQLVGHELAAFCKQELADTPVIGQFMRASGAIFVDRENTAAARQPFLRGVEALRAGRSVAVAPEGTRSAGGEIAAFKPGAFLMARKAQVLVVPVVLHNSGDALPRGSLLVRPATVRVTVLEPIDVGAWRVGEFDQRVRALENRYREVLSA